MDGCVRGKQMDLASSAFLCMFTRYQYSIEQ